MKKLLLALSLLGGTCLYGMVEPEEVLELYVEGHRQLLDTALFERILSLFKPDVQDILKTQRGKKERIELPHASTRSFAEIITSLEPIEKKDTATLRKRYLTYMTEKKHTDFFDLVNSADALGIEVIVIAAQDFYTKDFRAMIDHEDSTFYIRLLAFQKDSFPAWGSINVVENEYTPLGYAAAQGKTEIVQALLASGALVDQVDDDGVTPVIEAARNGYLDTVKVLLDAKATLNWCARDGRSALMEAAINGHLEMVNHLVAVGADQNLKDETGMTALEHAAMHQKYAVVKELGGQEAAVNPQLFGRKIRAGVMARKLSQKISTPPTPPVESKSPLLPMTQKSPENKKEPKPAPLPHDHLDENKKIESTFTFVHGLCVGVFCFLMYKVYENSTTNRSDGPRQPIYLH